MEVMKRTILFLTAMIFIFHIIDFEVYANTIPSNGIVTDTVVLSNGDSFQYVKSITSQRTGGKFNVEQQGYRISLMEETGVPGGGDHAECAVAVRCILDLVNSESDPTFLSNQSCTASYGFKNNKRYDVSAAGDITIQRLFMGTDVDEENPIACSDYALVGKNDTLCDGFDKIQGQCKLTYKHCYEQGFLEQNLFNFHGSMCNNRHIITKPMLEAAGYKIKNNDDFWFYSESNGMKTAQFYDKSENSSIRFFMALIKLFEEKWSGFNIAELSKYYFIFEPIIWFYNSKVEDKHSANDSLTYSFYGTLTELAYIQLNSRAYGEVAWANAWANRFGFAYIDSDGNRSASGAWLEDMQVCAFVDGGAMMLRTSHKLSENEPVTIDALSSDFYTGYKNNTITYNSSYDGYCYGDYAVKNMGIACLQYNPPITYTAQNYEYRTDTEVVTSIKLTNNSSFDFLPSYESVSAYEAHGEEPVAIGAILEYTDKNGTPLTAEKISELGLPDFVSVQGIGSSKSFDPQRNAGFETTPSNETYLYFKWKTPDVPTKINITARFVGDNNKNPLFIRHSSDSVEGDNLLYSGSNYAYQNKTYTTVTFECDIKDTMAQLNESHVPPDTLGGFMDKPYESSTAEQQEKYEKNAEIFRSYSPNKVFDMKEYLSNPSAEAEKVKRLNWFEYSSYIDHSNNSVRLHFKQFRAESWLVKQQYTESWTSGRTNPVIVFDNVPQKISTADNGKTYKFIPSGYGFTYCFEENYQGMTLSGLAIIPVAPEDREIIKNSCTMFQNGVVLYPEFNYSADYLSTVETQMYEWFDGNDDTYDCVHALSHNDNSLNEKFGMEYINDDHGGPLRMKSRVHFIPVWFPDNTEYKAEVIWFDYWTPAGQIYDHETYTLYIEGNIYDNWYPTKSDVNQEK